VLQHKTLSRNTQTQKAGSLLRYFPASRASHSAKDNGGWKSNTRISAKATPSTAVCTKCMGDVHTSVASVGFSWPSAGEDFLV